MSSGLIQTLLDIVLIILVGAGLVQATRLLRHLMGLGQSRDEMARFVHEFGSTVTRAEAGIKNLRQAAREGGDDLERLIEKASAIRDELHFLVESADQIANRLGDTASHAVRTGEKPAEKSPPRQAAPAAAPVAEDKTAEDAAKKSAGAGGKPSSRAEKELLQALEKLG
jgi:hypothetical protein